MTRFESPYHDFEVFHRHSLRDSDLPPLPILPDLPYALRLARTLVLSLAVRRQGGLTLRNGLGEFFHICLRGRHGVPWSEDTNSYFRHVERCPPSEECYGSSTRDRSAKKASNLPFEATFSTNIEFMKPVASCILDSNQRTSGVSD